MLLASTTSFVTAMNWWSTKKEEPSYDQQALEAARKASRDDHLQNQMRKDPKLNLLLWRIDSIEDYIVKKFKELQDKVDALGTKTQNLEEQFQQILQNKAMSSNNNSTTEESKALIEALEKRIQALEDLTLKNRLEALEKLPAELKTAQDKIDSLEQQVSAQAETIKTNRQECIKTQGELSETIHSYIRRKDEEFEKLEKNLSDIAQNIKNEHKRIQEKEIEFKDNIKKEFDSLTKRLTAIESRLDVE